MKEKHTSHITIFGEGLVCVSVCVSVCRAVKPIAVVFLCVCARVR